MAKSDSFVDFIVNPPSNWSGVIGGLVVSLFGSAVGGIASVITGDIFWKTMIWLAVAVIILVVLFLIQKRTKKLVLVPENQQPARYKGLIALVSKGRPGEDPMKQSVVDAIEYHKQGGLAVCWLVASPGEDGSFPFAQQIESKFETPELKIEVRCVGDLFDPMSTYELVQKIYTEEAPSFGLREDEIIADFTGGVRTMSSGMVLACGEHRVMQYMYGHDPKVASVPRLFQFKP